MALVYASRAALRHAERLLPRAAILESVIEKEIERGNLHENANGKPSLVFDSRRKWVAKVTQQNGRLRPEPKSWLVVSVEPYRRSGTNGKAR
ncbi:hypothetical protein BH09ACT13_BH09ACT13_10390 [soil metagenome]